MFRPNNFITLISSNGESIEVDKDIRYWSSVIRRMMKEKCKYKGGPYPVNVESEILKDIISWCTHKDETPFKKSTHKPYIPPSVRPSKGASVIFTASKEKHTSKPDTELVPDKKVSSKITVNGKNENEEDNKIGISQQKSNITNEKSNLSNVKSKELKLTKSGSVSRKSTLQKKRSKRSKSEMHASLGDDDLILLKTSVKDEWEMNFLDVGMLRLRLYMIGARILGIRSLVQAITFKYAVLTTDKNGDGIKTLLDLPKFHKEGWPLFERLWDPDKNNFVSEKAKDFFTNYMYSTVCCDMSKEICVSRDIDYDMFPARITFIPSEETEGQVMYTIKNFFVD